ncbi:hypothetical protein [Enterococcus faecalis]|uniref:hypothetical protein n=1 Tax=Enterococcus faecalis TaxID=1351 RepID=UPI0004BCCB49|nr:hypothetical protein [Enterococcus faecalis]
MMDLKEALWVLKENDITSSVQMLRRWIRQGKIKATLLSKKEGYIVDPNSLNEFIELKNKEKGNGGVMLLLAKKNEKNENAVPSEIKEMTYDAVAGFTIKKFKCVGSTNTVIEFEDDSDSHKGTFLNGLLKASLETVRVVDTDNGFGLRVYSVHASDEKLKEIISNYYQAILDSRERDFNEAIDFYNQIQENLSK